jgi:hypothetical protein
MMTKYQVNPEVLSTKIDEEAVLMSIEADSYFSLDPIGSHIWEVLSEKAASIDELVAVLSEEYEIDEATCRKDVGEFIAVMSEKKLIKPL